MSYLNSRIAMTQFELHEFIRDSKNMTSTLIRDRVGTKLWISNDNRYVGGPAIEYVDGSTLWYINGFRHREDGPAIECPNGSKEWWLYDKLHRLDGPAIEHADGSTEWSIYSKYVSYPERDTKQMQGLNNLLKLTLLQNKSRKFNEWLFDPDHYAGKWHKKNMLRDFQDS